MSQTRPEIHLSQKNSEYSVFSFKSSQLDDDNWIRSREISRGETIRKFAHPAWFANSPSGEPPPTAIRMKHIRETDMKRILLACSALFLVPLLSGCCCCGSYTDPYGSPYSGNYYGECLPSAAGRPVSQGMSGNCSNCQGDNNFSLPPLDSGVPMYSPSPTPAPVPMPSGGPTTSIQPVPGQPVYGEPIYGPEIVGPEITTGDAHYVPQGAVQGSSVPMAPASPYSINGTNALMPPAPVPAINTNSTVIPSPNPYPASQPQAGSGPMVPQTPPPPPEPVTQMRFRAYR